MSIDTSFHVTGSAALVSISNDSKSDVSTLILGIGLGALAAVGLSFAYSYYSTTKEKEFSLQTQTQLIAQTQLVKPLKKEISEKNETIENLKKEISNIEELNLTTQNQLLKLQKDQVSLKVKRFEIGILHEKANQVAKDLLTKKNSNENIESITLSKWLELYNELFKTLGTEIKLDLSEETIDDCIKLSYIIGLQTLNQLKKENKSGKDLAEVITNKTSNFYSPFLCLPTLYHGIRYECRNAVYPEEAKKEFYETGTVKNGWRLLFNYYCEKIQEQISQDDFGTTSTHCKLTAIDEQSDKFFPRVNLQRLLGKK